MTTPEQDAGTPTPLPDDIWIDYTVECFRCGGSGCLECNMSGRRPRYFDEWKKTECELSALRTAHEAAQAEIAALQARIDELMLEYCPEDMTPEQIKNWEAHQQPVSKEMERTIDDSARKETT